MDPLYLAVKFGVYVLMALGVAGAIAAVTVRNLFHAALAFAFTLLAVAGIYLALKADFLAVVQILIYVGAIMTLVIFVVMLTERFGDKNIPQSNSLSLPAWILICLTFGGFINFAHNTPWPIKAEGVGAAVSVYDLGVALMTTYAFPFEIISVILIAALIGAVLIAKKDKVS